MGFACAQPNLQTIITEFFEIFGKSRELELGINTKCHLVFGITECLRRNELRLNAFFVSEKSSFRTVLKHGHFLCFIFPQTVVSNPSGSRAYRLVAHSNSHKPPFEYVSKTRSITPLSICTAKLK